MQMPESNRANDIFFRRALQIVLGMLFVYLAAAAYFGVVVGQTMHRARANPLIDTAAIMLGREASERYVIHRLGVPRWILRAPTFWLALRMSE
jgi:ribose/xylose/arabinose/galactoside ABC-type transport system permease subunit